MNKLRIWFYIPLFFIITSCLDYTITRYFNNYQETEGSTARGWLPDYFPEEAINIKLVADLDFNDYVVSFLLEPSNEKEFEEHIRKNIFIKKADDNIKNKVMGVFGRSKYSNDFFCFFSNQSKGGESVKWSVLYKKNEYYFITNIKEKEYRDFCY